MASQDIPLIGPILGKIFGTRNERFVKRYTLRVEQINALEPRMRALTDGELRGKLAEFRERRAKGESAEELLPEVFATAREAMDRSVGIRNIFNPELGFDASILPAGMREVYARVKAEMDATPAVLPATMRMRAPARGKPAEAPQGLPDTENRYLGELDAVPGWRQVAIPPELYEAVREIFTESKPPFRSRPFDVQLIGGMVLGQGKIAEMKTGEGKTIVGPLACYMAGVNRERVHVVTVNDYLVQRDRDWTAPFFAALGMTVGAIHPMQHATHPQPEEVKRLMYRCDVVYGTTSEFGFDYLRDNMKPTVDMQVQRRRQFAIVDEVDSVLIDEARTPLIISGEARDDKPRYDEADRLARHLVEKQKPWQKIENEVQKCKEEIKGLEGDIRQVRDKGKIPELQQRLAGAKGRLPELERERDRHVQYYEVQEERKAAYLTHEGTAEAQRAAGLGSFYVDENMDLPHLVQQAVRAHAVYLRDRDYIVMDLPDRMTGQNVPSVVIVDSNTGRPMVGRQWSDGLHQAIEAKEAVPIKQETQTVATVTVQNYFKMYKRLAGMTGTADTEAQEFHDIYKLDVVAIPTNRAISRTDHEDLMFLREKDKWEAIVDEIKHFNDVGRPILVGTTSVEKSETLSQMLKRKHQVPHEVLNAKQHDREALIVAEAGKLGAVMIATNMAGRGTDIKLGRFTREELLTHWLKRGIASRKLTLEATDEQLREDVYRMIAPAELEKPKREVEGMTFDALELELLRAWALRYTLESPERIEKLDAAGLREALDAGGRFLMHRLRWFASIEDMGGLHVIGTERHESRRIDNQLRGRSGRQGDRGSSRFFVAAEDELMRLFMGEFMQRLLARMGMKEGEAIQHSMLSKNIERAQRKVEEMNFQRRKNLLEYEEVVEHQRQKLYGVRQRVLEGRDVKGLIFEHIEASVDDAVAERLDPEYPAVCAAEYAKERLECSILPERLKGKTPADIDTAIRRMAKEDASHMIDVTLGEYMPMEGSEVSVDFDSAGLVRWAKNRFGVDIDSAELREGGEQERRDVKERLERAAFEKIDQADLGRLPVFFEPGFGAERLAEWVKGKFGFEVKAEELLAAQRAAKDGRAGALGPREVVLDKARELYRKREAEYPVDFRMEETSMLMQQDRDMAMARLAEWARRRMGLEMTPGDMMRQGPQAIRAKLLEAATRFVDDERIESAVAEASACADEAALEAHLRERYNATLPERMRWLEPAEREEAIRGLIENLLRPELLFVEQRLLLPILDEAWKDHLYQMDQLRDTINFRAFSQQDPKIAYKREGSRVFLGTEESIRDKVTDYLFKLRVSPASHAQAMRR